MRPSESSDLSEEVRDCIDAYLDGTIEPEEFDSLQERMLEDPGLRAAMRRYLAIDNFLQNECEVDASSPSGATAAPWLQADSPQTAGSRKILRSPNPWQTAAAAAVAFILGLGFMYFGSKRGHQSAGAAAEVEVQERFARGFAVVGRLFDVEWADRQPTYREGDTLGAEVIRLDAGTVEIQFFSGAMMTLQGPAEISLKSAWEASCVEGAVRMHVPPAARGFRLQAPSTEIVDLGTEFGLVVREGKGHVEVFEGEISLRHQGENELIMKMGSARDLTPDLPSVDATTGQFDFPDSDQFAPRAAEQRLSDFEQWQSHRDSLAQDRRLIAFYTFDHDNRESLIPNLTVPRNPDFDGSVIMAEEVDGRWPGMKSALEFRRPGSRVRVNIPGEFAAFTFVSWVRIDSLDRRYNALFMGDGYENGEPHWQIRDDGKVMLSVMVDDTRPHPKYPQSRFHHVYFSPPMWDLSMSGQWLHIASVYDPQNRAASHYVNGKRLSREEIQPEYLVETVRIGNGEIGNWGQPFREDPTFAIRNLNGRMDEIAIFRTALGDQEIADLYERSRSGRR